MLASQHIGLKTPLRKMLLRELESWTYRFVETYVESADKVVICVPGHGSTLMSAAVKVAAGIPAGSLLNENRFRISIHL